MTSALLEDQLALDLDRLSGDLDAEPEPPPLPAYVPTVRVPAVIERWLEGGRTLDDLAARTGVPGSTLSAIRRRRRQQTRFTVADQIVTRIDVFLWHRPPEEGGLADLYGSLLYRREEAA